MGKPTICSTPAALLALAASTASASQFVDQTTASGLVASTGISQVSPILGGGAVGDIDGDGWADVFFPSGGNGPDRLFINQGDGTFVDQAAAWGVAFEHLSASATIVDYDGDGRLDIHVLSFGPVGAPAVGHHRLYRNTGSGFVETAQAAGIAWTTQTVPDGWSASWGDYDLDGDLDLAVAGYRQQLDSNRVFRNNGDGSFTDITGSLGLVDLQLVAGFAPRFANMDDIRGPELIWIGDFSTAMYFANTGDGQFIDWTEASGTSLDNSEMGVGIGDWNQDGRFDFYVSTIGTNNLYLNQGGNVFINAAAASGTEVSGWGWAVAAMDFDNDSNLDIVVAAQKARNRAFRNTSVDPLLFEEIGVELGFTVTDNGRGMASFDADRDGDQDLLVFRSGGPLRYYENRVPPADHHWFRVELDRGVHSDQPPNGIGAIVRIRTGSRWLHSQITAGNNYLSQDEMVAHFGLGTTDRVDELRVEWPNGHRSRLFDLEADQQMLVVAEHVNLDGFE